MASRLKEDEKNEKAIRSLLRKTPNRRCINCNSLGPQYVCLNFWTFVCTQCSGIHREFTHRVKSVSMSKFTSQEVANLETGGNERGREIYFKDWDSQRQPLPDSSNVDRLREFIKMVYVDKRLSGERPLPRPRGGDREDAYDSRRPEPRPNYRADSRSPPYEDRYDERPSGGRRSNAGYDDRRFDERARYDERARFDEKRSPGRFETDRNRYDKNYNDARRYDDRPRYETRDRQHSEDRYNDGLDRRFEDRFANERGNRNYGGSSPPPIRPVKEILGEDVPPLRVETHGNQTNGGRELEKSHSSQDVRGQRFGSSSSFGSVDGNVPAAAPVIKREDSTSLIDFSVEPDPPAAREQPDPFGLTAGVQSSADVSNSTGWATFGSAAPAPFVETLAQPPTVASAQGVSGGFTSPTNLINGSSQWEAQWTATPALPAADTSASSWSSLMGPSVPAASSQPWNAFPANSTEAVSAPQSAIPHDPRSGSSSAGVATQVMSAQPSGRSEIPQDFFGGSLASSVQFAGAPPFGSQPFGSQYPAMGGMGMLPGNYSQPQKSRNPFDLPGDSGVGPVAREFPSLTSMQAALPTLNMGPRPVPVPAMSPYGSQWNQSNTMAHQPPPLYSSGPMSNTMAQPPPLYSSGPMSNTMAQPQPLYSSAPMSAGSGVFFSQQSQTVMPQTMQGSMGHPLGANVPGSFYNAPKQATETFFTAPNFQQLPSQNSFGGAESMFTAQGAGPQFPYHNPAGPATGNSTSPDSFMAGRLGQSRLLSQSSLGSLHSMPSGDSLFPAQPPLPGQRLVSHASLGSLSSFTGADNQFSVQSSSQFPTHSSLGPVGNPFG